MVYPEYLLSFWKSGALITFEIEDNYVAPFQQKILRTESLNRFLVDCILYMIPQFVAEGIHVFHVTPLEENHEKLPDFYHTHPMILIHLLILLYFLLL